MIKFITICTLLLAACGDDYKPTPDATLPLCTDLGCENSLCDRDGVCECAGVTCVIETKPCIEEN